MASEMEEIEKELGTMEGEMAKVMQQARSVVKESGRCIVAMHSGRMDDAHSMLMELGRMVSALSKIDNQFGHYSLDAYQEYSEAFIVYTYLKEGRIPARKEVSVSSRAYLLGMLDAVGELKRHAFNLLRANKSKEAARVCKTMQEIVDDTSPMRFPDGLVPGLRGKQDTARRHVGDIVEQLVSRKA